MYKSPKYTTGTTARKLAYKLDVVTEIPRVIKRAEHKQDDGTEQERRHHWIKWLCQQKRDQGAKRNSPSADSSDGIGVYLSGIGLVDHAQAWSELNHGGNNHHRDRHCGK